MKINEGGHIEGFIKVLVWQIWCNVIWCSRNNTVLVHTALSHRKVLFLGCGVLNGYDMISGEIFAVVTFVAFEGPLQWIWIGFVY